MNGKERGSHVRGVHPTQGTSHMGTVRVKQEAEADTRIILRNMEERYMYTKRKSPKQGLTTMPLVKYRLG